MEYFDDWRRATLGAFVLMCLCGYATYVQFMEGDYLTALILVLTTLFAALATVAQPLVGAEEASRAFLLKVKGMVSSEE